MMVEKKRKVTIIAEIGQAHEGSLGIAHSYIDALKGTGIDVIKFQIHIADAESSLYEPFRVNFSYEDETRRDYWKRMEFTYEQWSGLKHHCEKNELEFMASPFSLAAVGLLEKLDVKRYKIGSGEITNYLLLEKIAMTGKPIIVSSGMSSFNELDSTINFLKSFGSDLTILQCTTAYPTNPTNWGLNVIQELRQKYPFKIGFSDHSGDIFACLAATALSAEVLEFHIVFDKKMFGPDAQASLTILEAKKLVEGVRQIETALNYSVNKNDNSVFSDVKKIFGKSLAVNKKLKPGHEISFKDLETKKPKGYGIDASQYRKVLGKKTINSLRKGDFLNWKDLE